MQCLLCGHGGATRFLNLGRQPLANKYPATESDFTKEDFFSLEVYFCPDCKNVQLETIVSRERMFEDYYYLSSVNPGLVRHFEKLAKELAGARFVVDIGSNDGILLKPLKESSVRAVGIDPSINVSKIANDAGLTTIVSFFDAKTAEEIKARYGQPDVVVASSVFTHVEDPHQFIEDVKVLMAADGRFIVEVEYIVNIIKNVQFERFYLDRVFYYSLTSLKKLFESHGMRVTDVEEIEPHGGSLRVTAMNASFGPEHSQKIAQFLEREARDLTPAKLEEFARETARQIHALHDRLLNYKKSGLRVAGYGAPARVATICNYGNIGPELIEFIVDDSPLKQNRFSPGTHIPIVGKSSLGRNKPDVLVVFAYEYLDDIRKKTDGKYRYLVPIPPREVS